jgi:ubiquinol oxidase
MYLFAPRTAHRFVAYLEEEAVISYTGYLDAIDAGELENVPAPQIAIDYWNLPADARLRDVVLVVREDEAAHRDTNHRFADELGAKEREAADAELAEVEAKAKTKVDA